MSVFVSNAVMVILFLIITSFLIGDFLFLVSLSLAFPLFREFETAHPFQLLGVGDDDAVSGIKPPQNFNKVSISDARFYFQADGLLPPDGED